MSLRVLIPSFSDISLYYDGTSHTYNSRLYIRYLLVFLTHWLGVHADLNETYPVGRVDDESLKLMRTTRESLDAAIAICKPGALYRDIGKTMYVVHHTTLYIHFAPVLRLIVESVPSEPIARANGCAVVRTYYGHGINELFHPAAPNIPHYAKNKAIGTMKPGHLRLL